MPTSSTAQSKGVKPNSLPSLTRTPSSQMLVVWSKPDWCLAPVTGDMAVARRSRPRGRRRADPHFPWLLLFAPSVFQPIVVHRLPSYYGRGLTSRPCIIGCGSSPSRCGPVRFVGAGQTWKIQSRCPRLPLIGKWRALLKNSRTADRPEAAEVCSQFGQVFDPTTSIQSVARV